MHAPPAVGHIFGTKRETKGEGIPMLNICCDGDDGFDFRRLAISWEKLAIRRAAASASTVTR